MPMEKERYPADWKRIALEKKESVGWVCEVCGKQCRKPGEPFDTHKRTLTVAHLNHTPEDCRPENLRAMCAVCHLKYDARHHAETRRSKRKTEPTCPHCKHSIDEDGLLVCILDDRVKDDTMTCDEWNGKEYEQ